MKTASFFTFTGEGRVSIARYAPTKTPPGFATYRRLAPGSWFNSVSRERYIELFRKEILGWLDPKHAWDELHALTKGTEPVLLCWEKPPFTDENFCHRRLVAEWFGEKLGVDVPELIPPPKPPRRGRTCLVLPGM